MGFNYKDVEEGCQIAVEEVAKLARDVELPPFRDLGAKKEDLEEIAIKSAKNGSNMDNPRPMEKDDYQKFLVGLFNNGQ
jgi:alcohol dehydrogenase class IV